MVRKQKETLGPVNRFREHLLSCNKLKAGTAKLQNKHRYKILMNTNAGFLGFLVLEVVHRSTASAVEAARIAYARPRANYVDDRISSQLGIPIRVRPEPV